MEAFFDFERLQNDDMVRLLFVGIRRQNDLLIIIVSQILIRKLLWLLINNEYFVINVSKMEF